MFYEEIGKKKINYLSLFFKIISIFLQGDTALPQHYLRVKIYRIKMESVDTKPGMT